MSGLRAMLGVVVLGAILLAGRALAVDAFPGAEGFGATNSGGRGKTVYHVTNLNNSGAGSLRNAAAMSNVTIVFDVGGYIVNGSKLGFTGTNVTIAGQTAPGGIGTMGQGVSIGGNNIILRHFRSRPGKSASSAPDTLNINNDVDGLIVDHCSLQFGVDENNSMDRPRGVTNQWSFNAWGLQTHSAGSLLYANNTTVHHTLWAHNHTRNPKARYGLLDWVNNVIFDWDIPYILADADSDVHWANVDRCYFISGASGQNRSFTSGQLDSSSGLPTYSMWLNQTLTDFDTDGVLDGTDKGYGVVSGSVNHTASRYAAPQVTTQDATTAYKLVLSLGGATPWARDEVDTLLVNDAKNHTRRIITRPSDLPVSAAGFGTLGGVAASPDSDQDGMPDYFEIAMGYSPTTASNNGDGDANGYTNLEEYLNWLGAPNAKASPNTAVDINLKTYTFGFGAAATYSVSNPTLGTVALLGDGFTARFTPTSGASGMGGFDFTVNDGSVATIHIGVLVLGTSSAPTITPNPSTFSSAPAAVGATQVTMTATTANSSGGVQYYFTCTSGPGHDSGWQSGTAYTDTGLPAGTTYAYTVKVRDAVFLNETTPSAALPATTAALPSLAAPGAWWKLDEASGATCIDATGNGNTGTLGGPTPPTRTTAGKLGGALNFDGPTTGAMTAPSSASIDFADTDFSVSFWLKEPATMADNSQEEILMKGSIQPTASTSGKRYEFYRKRAGTSDTFRFAIDDNVTKSEINVLSNLLCTGDWVHVCAVRNTVNNTLYLYANGVQVGTAVDATGSISQSEPMRVGDSVMIGLIDEVKVYGYALTGDQVVADLSGDTSAPAAPRKLSAHATSTGVVLNWSDNTESDLAGYIVKRSITESGPYTVLNSNVGTSQYTDAGATAATYFYVVTAIDNTDNESGESNEAVATPWNAPDLLGPDSPTSLTATAGLRKVRLNWDSNTEPDLGYYIVQRATVAGGPYTTIAQGITGNSYADTTAAVGTTYYYVVLAVDTTNNVSEDPSNEASAAAVGSVTLQAEEQVLGGGSASEATNAGYHASGYVNSPTTGGSIEWQNVDGTGVSATLRFRTALASGSRTGNLVINGVTQNITFNATGAFTTWVDVDVSALLKNGPTNTIRLETTGQDLANIDDLTILVAAADLTAPGGPIGLTATGGAGVVTLNWGDNTELDLATYNVKRSTTSGSGYTLLATGVPVSGFSDYSGVTGTTYFYVVTAVDTSGNESGNSSQASAASLSNVHSAAGAWGLYE